jgi:hypothetical protein
MLASQQCAHGPSLACGPRLRIAALRTTSSKAVPSSSGVKRSVVAQVAAADPQDVDAEREAGRRYRRVVGAQLGVKTVVLEYAAVLWTQLPPATSCCRGSTAA